MKTVLTETLRHAERDPDRLCTLALSARSGDARRSFGEVAQAAGRAAAFLRARDVGAGDVVVLLGTHDADLHAAWLGVVWLGAVPTILAEPSVRVDRELYAARLAELLGRIQARAVLVSARAGVTGLDLGGLPIFRYDEVTAGSDSPPAIHDAGPDDLLLLQHSSGTTGLHKGVMLTHGAVVRHAASYHAVLAPRPDDLVVSWLPLYHDMGLIACFVSPLLAGTPVVALSPFEWVAAPSAILRAASEHRATHMWLPNFAFQVLATRTREPRGTFDLSALRAVVNCSEPVSAASMDELLGRFSDDGLRREALQTCYAMAENVFAVTSTSAGDLPRTCRVRRATWQAQHRAEEAPADDATALRFVSSGRPVAGCEVSIVDAGGAALPARAAGRILVRSDFALDGYFRRDDLNARLFDDAGRFDTGDLGFLDEDGHLYVTGREKDIVIVGGKNVYPQDIEQIANEVEGVHPGRVVCFGVDVTGLATEALVVLFESEAPEARWVDIVRAVRVSVPARLDLDLVDCRIVARGALRKSTSGKLARAGNREWYLSGRFGPLPASIKRESP